MKNKILFLDDNRGVIDTFDSIIFPFLHTHFAIEMVYCTQFDEARKNLNDDYLLVISDFNLSSHHNGLDFYSHLRSEYSLLPFILFSSDDFHLSDLSDRNLYTCNEKNWRLLRVLICGILCAAQMARWDSSKQCYLFE